MDFSKQDTPHSSENSIYRTAFKLRSMQTLCQLDLVSSTLVREVLLHPRLSKASTGSLSVPQLSRVLQELFRRASVETRAQVPRRASELTLSLLMAMFDSPGMGVLKLLPVAAALIALSGDSPLTKYKALFQLYAENNKDGYESGARITRSKLRNLLTDLQQIPAVVGESRRPSSVDSAVRSCFQGVLSPGIREEKFLSWAQSEPGTLLWLPTCYQLSATETVTHPARCSLCRAFPIIGLRYHCLKCPNFDICQVCFLSGLHSKSHQKSHPAVEHCVQQMSAKENTELLLGKLRSSLLQGRCWRKRDLRRPEDPAHHAQAKGSSQYHSSENPVRVRPARPAEAAAAKASRCAHRGLSQAQQVSRTSPHHQTMLSIKNELWRTRESINALQRERRLLKKQLHRYKDKLRAIYTFQKEKSCRFETKIQELTRNQDSLRSKLQQMRQDVQAMLQPSSSGQHMVSEFDYSSAHRLWKGGDASQIKNVTEDGPGCKPPPKPALVDRNQANADHAPPDSEAPATMAQTTGAQSCTQKIPKKILSSLPSSQQGLLQDKPQISRTEMTSTALGSAGREEIVDAAEQKDELEEEELQALLWKLMDAFNLEMPPGPWSSVNADLYGGAERVCRAFSALVDQIASPNLKRESRLNSP